MTEAEEEIIEELDALWRVRFGQPLPVVAEPQMIIRVMRKIEEKRQADDQAQFIAQA